jgi:hypothetical protein
VAAPRLQPLETRLALASFLKHEFGLENLEDVSRQLNEEEVPQLEPEGSSGYLTKLEVLRRAGAPVGFDTLKGYDANIVAHTESLSVARGTEIRWRYFQYLELLFVERYFDRRFDDRSLLVADLNKFLGQFNECLVKGSELPTFTTADMDKLAVWSATGSGKTLLMHVNLLQFQHYAVGHDAVDRTILLTPNESLSRQHERELRASGIDAAVFSKESPSLFRSSAVEVIDVQKFRDTEKEKTVAVERFEGRNLVLVDEGHRGAKGETWMAYRDQLASDGFTIEYSATFGQSFGSDCHLSAQYAKWIGFEYAYRHFHADGYGKDYEILNLPDDSGSTLDGYLCGAMLLFIQQRLYFRRNKAKMAKFNIEPPLWAFVGSSVVGKLGSKGASDVVAILEHFAKMVGSPSETSAAFERLLLGDPVVSDRLGRNVFEGAFEYLNEEQVDGESAFGLMLKLVFGASSPGKIRVVLRRGVEGEIALQLGDSPVFGVVSVGDAPKLHKLCESSQSLICDEAKVSQPLFDQLAEREEMSLLVGAKKFIEGWDSWRVSQLGLMNVGRSEGSQIIQLFGRGVRLLGFDRSLKRSSHIDPAVDRPDHLNVVETLIVVGVRADYMSRFREMLEAEGIETEKWHELRVATTRQEPWPSGISTIRLPKAVRFSTSERTALGLPGADGPAPIHLNLYAHAETISSTREAGVEASFHRGVLGPQQRAFLSVDRLLAELNNYKRQRGLVNLEITESGISDLLENPDDWYVLEVPPERLEATGFDRAEDWHAIAIALLRTWSERQYHHSRQAWESPRLEYEALTTKDTNIVSEFIVSVSQEAVASEQLESLRAQLEAGEPAATVGNLRVVTSNEHLYYPLLAQIERQEESDVRVTPVALNSGEKRFVDDLGDWLLTNKGRLDGVEVHLLRNLSRGKGIGFFDAGNFYPDFILWLKTADGRQRIGFIDPKGILRLGGISDPKIELHKTIKDLEKQLGDPSISLHSFILSVTPFNHVYWNHGLRLVDFEERNVLFLPDDPLGYIEKLFQKLDPDLVAVA